MEIARILAAHGCHLILAARRRDRLDQLADQLGRSHGTECDVVTVDLADDAGAAGLIAAVSRGKGPIDVLVNNAGRGIHGSALEHEWEDERSMLVLNILTVAELTKHFAREMKSRGTGRILQVASTAAFQPTANYAAYGATKAFVLHHAEALDEELRGTDVRITTLCPGSTDTEFFTVSGNVRSQVQEATSMAPDEVARIAVRAMRSGKRSVVSGLANRMAVAGLRVIPRRVQASIARRILE